MKGCSRREAMQAVIPRDGGENLWFSAVPWSLEISAELFPCALLCLYLIGMSSSKGKKKSLSSSMGISVGNSNMSLT